MIISSKSYWNINKINNYVVSPFHTIKGDYPPDDRAFFGISNANGIDVFIKLANPSCKENILSLIKELEVLEKLNHKNIMRVIDKGEVCISFDNYKINSVPYIVMNKMEFDLYDAMRIKKIEWNSIKNIITGVFLGISEIHKHLLIHGDIRIINILSSSDFNEIKISDFSNVKSLPRKNKKINRAGPLREHEPLDDSVSFSYDIFSFGSVVFNLVAHGNFHKYAYLHSEVNFKKNIPNHAYEILCEILHHTSLPDPVLRERHFQSVSSAVCALSSA